MRYGWIAGAALVAFAPTGAEAATLTVGLDGGQYNTIAEAISQARNRDTVLVYPGVYTENLDFGGKSIVLKSSGGAATTTIQGSSTAIYLHSSENADTRIEGFTLKSSGSYIVRVENSDPTFVDCTISGARSSYAAYFVGSTATLSGLTFQDNTTSYNLYVHSNSDLIVSNTAFLDNTTTYGGGVTVTGTSIVEMSDVVFDNNKANNYGGAIYLSSGSYVTVENGQFLGNTASRAGAVYLESGSSMSRISNSHFGNNTSANYGGALYNYNTRLHLNDNTFADNVSATGGAIYLNQYARTALVNNTFVLNEAGSGGAIYAYRTTDTLLYQNIFTGMTGGHAIEAEQNEYSSRILGWYNLFYDNYPSDFGGNAVNQVGTRGNIQGDPALEGFIDDRDPTNDDFTPASSSPAIDAGSSAFVDADGSRADIGAGGGDDLARPVSGNIVVAPQGLGDAIGIKEAVLAADEGDSIIVYPGLYYGDIDFLGKNVQISSAYDASSTVMTGAGTLMTYDANETAESVIDGLTAWTNGAYSVYVHTASPVVRNMHFRFNKSGSYVTYNHAGTALYQNNLFEHNDTGYNQYFRNGCQATLVGNRYIDNRASYGAGFSSVSSAVVTANNNLFRDNYTSNHGGAVYTSGGAGLNLADNRFFNNTSNKYGGAIYMESLTADVVRISGNHFAGNRATTGGGAIFSNGLTAYINDNAFTDNSGTTGGVFYLNSSARTALFNNTFVGNPGGTTGGVIYAYNSSTTTLLQNIFAGTESGGAVHSNNANAKILSWYNLFYDNADGNYTGAALDEMGLRGNRLGDPLLTGYSADDDPYNDTFEVAEGSPAINGGSTTFKDADGTRADIGIGGSQDEARPVDGDIIVAQVGTADYSSITEAIAAASRGDKIIVYPGFYYGNVDPDGTNMEIESAFGPHTAMISGGNQVIRIDSGEDDRLVIDGFSAWSNSTYVMYVYNTQPRIRNMHFRNHQSSHALYIQGSTVDLVSPVFEDNTATYPLYMHSSTVDITSPTFHRNRVTHGGGMTVVANADVTLMGGSFEDNYASNNGGAIYYSGGRNLRVLNSTFLRNYGSYGGAMYIESGTGQVELRDNYIALNEANNYGGAIYGSASLIYAADNRIVENEANYGGAYYLTSNARSAIVNDTIVGNVGSIGGGIYAYRNTDTLVANSIIAYQDDGEGIFTEQPTARLFQVHTDIYGNYDGSYGGYMSDRTGEHGNLAVEPKFIRYSVDGDLSNDDLRLASFSALKNAGIPGLPDADGTRGDMGYGGGDDDARESGYTYTVSAHGDADFRKLSDAIAAARNGDSIAVYSGIYDGDVNYSGKDLNIVGVRGPLATVFATASYGVRLDSGEGGGLYSPSLTGVSIQSRGSYGLYLNGTTLDMSDCQVRFCTSSYGGYAKNAGLNLDGVVFEDNNTSYTLYYQTSTGTISSSDFRRNRSGYGGALYTTSSSVVEIVDMHAIGNVSTHQGGALYSTGSEVTVLDSVLSNNTAASHGGAIYADSSSDITLGSSMVALNTAAQYGGALHGASSGTAFNVKNNIFLANTAQYGGAVSVASGTIMQITNNDVLENTATQQGGGMYAASGSTLRSVNNIVAYQDDGEGIYVHPSSSYDIRYNDLYQNYNGAVGGAIAVPPQTNIDDDPEFVRHSIDRDPTNDDFHLADGSVCIDGGDPSLYDDENNTDRSDIGAYGGGGLPSLDFDGDGYTNAEGDCDDNDATVYPGAPELEDGKDNDCNGVGDDPFVDQDGDGYSFEEGDCDDADGDINPGENEQCDSVDNDCDGLSDEGVSTTYYQDSDDDGYGRDASAIQACTPPAGYSATAGDCNDASDAVNPGADEICDGLDNDCNGDTDEAGDTTFYLDPDGDGFGTSATTIVACDLPSGYAEQGGDCAEGDATINPGATEVCDDVDNNCDGRTDEGLISTFYDDDDGDGYGDATEPEVACSLPDGYAEQAGDCDDTSGDINPGATEVCDDVDNNCDGRTDEDLRSTFYADDDGDGYGDAGTTSQACEVPSGFADQAGDCDDSAFNVNPGADETCNEVDDDCDTQVDEGLTSTWYFDGDADGYGLNNTTLDACNQPGGYASESGDCDDLAFGINPGATEVCDGDDNNCDGATDEGFDADGDGVPTCSVDGVPADCDDDEASAYPGATEACDGIDNDCDSTVDEVTDDDGDGYTGCDGDCDDSNADAYPGNTEVCDGADNDCNGTTDEGFDNDGDGFPICSVGSTGPDCNDDDADINPGESEICDGEDNNCSGTTDEGFDNDSDGYPVCVVGEQPADCRDSDAEINPGAEEICDGADNDCDGIADEGVLFTYCIDEDEDGYGSPEQAQTTCDPDDGFVRNCTDFNDDDDDTYPGAVEVPDGSDNDGDGDIDEGTIYADDDGDGFSEDEGDCDDDDVQTFPGQDEFIDGQDNDCDNVIDESPSNDDSDGDGYSAADGDCDDDDAGVNPGADEASDDVDNDCDGAVDEGTTGGDDDGDGYTEEEGDCDDTNPHTYPGADEFNDGEDNDCNGSADDNIDEVDNDGDGYSEEEGDCDDSRPDVNPGADEVADGTDNDCDNQVDEGTSNFDEDGDGYSPADGDCDDENPYVNPGVEENPNNGVDDDCDGNVDGEGTPTPDEETPTVSLGTGRIVVDVDILDFSDVAVDDSKLLGLEIRNTGDGVLTVEDYEIVQADPLFTVLSSFPVEIDPDDSETIFLEFAPIDVGSVSAILTLLSDDPVEDELDVAMRGRGVDEGDLTPTVEPTEAPTLEPGTPPTGSDTPGVTETPTWEPTQDQDNTPEGGDPSPTDGPTTDEGCNCSSGGTSTPNAIAWMVLIGLGLAIRRRRS